MTFNYIIISIIIMIIITGIIRKVNIYNAFFDGAKQGLAISINMFSYLLTFTFAITLFKSSGIIDDIASRININFSPLLIVQAFIRPMSSSSSLLICIQLYESSGVDSLDSIISTLLHSASDSTLYVMGFYYGVVEVKKYDKELKYGLLLNLVATILAILFGSFIASFVNI